jgi:hypothetical protein
MRAGLNHGRSLRADGWEASSNPSQNLKERTPRFLWLLNDEFLRSCRCIEQEPPIMSSIPLEFLSFKKDRVDKG